MVWMFIGLLALLGLIGLGRYASSADPARLATVIRLVGGGAAVALGLLFLVRGALLIAAPLIVLGLRWMWRGRAPAASGGPGADRGPGFDRAGGGQGREQRRDEGGAHTRRAPPGADMSPEEAYAVLGLEPGADEAAIVEAHKRLIKRLHPDGGGSSTLAAKVNRARQVLLDRRR